jgi:hypothetical protein
MSWVETADLAKSGPEDRHYVLDRETGRIHFGDGERSAVPPAGCHQTELLAPPAQARGGTLSARAPLRISPGYSPKQASR